jgi:hypothetical protein
VGEGGRWWSGAGRTEEIPIACKVGEGDSWIRITCCVPYGSGGCLGWEMGAGIVFAEGVTSREHRGQRDEVCGK